MEGVEVLGDKRVAQVLGGNHRGKVVADWLHLHERLDGQEEFGET